MSVVTEIESLNQEFYAAIEGADLDRMEEIWADDTGDRVAMCVHPGWSMLTGRRAIMRSYALIMANTPYIQFVLTDVWTCVVGDVAVVSCAENILTAGDEGETGFVAGKVVATNTFVLTPRGWKLWIHHGSPVLQGEEDDEDGQEVV
ncbi:nuclear transport factor 2 family protein [Thermopolyspora sp. NPDC052614]|uniref:nuclear transport factor 2 family protein n=1 Tax=Thermopolyspora sp. NPDC052614 TaxID=3155682 RepID=UPI00342A55AA